MLTVVDGVGTAVDFGLGAIFAVVGVALAITALFYVLRSIGLYVMAKRQNLKYAYIAWIPFAWVFIAGKLSKTANIFGFRIKNFALFLTIFFSVSQGISLIFMLVQYVPLAGYLLQCASRGETALIGYAMSDQIVFKPEYYNQYQLMSGVYVGTNFTFTYAPWIIKTLQIMNIVTLVVDIVYMVLLYTMYFNLFRTYWPQHYFSAFLFSIFGLFPIFVFAFRKKDPINYEEFVKARYGDYMARRGQYYNDPFMDGQGGQNGYNEPNSRNQDPFGEFENSKSQSNSEPFSEYDKKEQDPFEEFSKKDGDK